MNGHSHIEALIFICKHGLFSMLLTQFNQNSIRTVVLYAIIKLTSDGMTLSRKENSVMFINIIKYNFNEYCNF